MEKGVNQLYGIAPFLYGTLGRIRTYDLWIRSPIQL